jgi:predicted TIM-barrel fold metal-dependent hydrolase
MIIDFATHIYPQGYLKRLSQLSDLPWGSFDNSPMWAVSETNPATKDLELRARSLESFEAFDYRQVISLVGPPLDDFLEPKKAAEIARETNEELASLVREHPEQFIGALGMLILSDQDAATAEVDHLVELGLPGAQVYSHSRGLPLDHPTILPVLEDMAARGLVIFLHPAKSARVPDYPTEEASKYVVWQLIGWPVATTVAMIRLCASGFFERHPDAKVVAHHMGAMVPFFEGRLDVHYDIYAFQHPMARDIPDDSQMKEPLIVNLRRFYGDTALDGGVAGVVCGLDFFGPEHVVFASDMPMDKAGGARFVRIAIEAVERSGASPQVKQAIFEGNARRLLNLATVVAAGAVS